MTTKRILALLAALLMIVALFSACANDGNTGDDDQNDDGNTGDTGDTGNTEDGDSPNETEPLKLTYMGCETHNWAYTLEEAQAKGFETWTAYNEKLLAEHNLVCEVETVDNESYKTTLAGLLAADSLYDCFLVEGDYMAPDVVVSAISNGSFANINDILPYSDGTFAGAVGDGGALQYIKAWSTAPDGEWYYVKNPDGGGSSFNFDHDDVDYLNNWPLHTWYDLNIRVDWLNKCGLDMPTTTEEFTEALIQFQAQDVNGNGAADERAFLGIGMATEQVFGHGTAGWFGLPRGNFAMSAVTGELENAVEFGDQYLAFVDFTANLYANGVALINEGGAWAYGANVAGNYCAAQVMYPDNLITVQTGDPDCQYEPMPIIQAIEGVAPRMQGQSINTANNALAFNVDCDYEAAAAYLDWLSGESFYQLLMYGIEGKAWDYNEDGTVTLYKVGVDITQEEDESYGDMWHYAPWSAFPQIQCGFMWDFVRNTYNSVEEALDNGEPYTWKKITFEDWKEQFKDYNWTDMSNVNRFLLYLDDYGTDNIVFDLNVNFTTLASEEEAQIISMYESDLKTYLSEMTTNYITGAKTTDTYEADLQYAYDNLAMQEYCDALQAQIDRYLVAMGRDAVLAQ